MGQLQPGKYFSNSTASSNEAALKVYYTNEKCFKLDIDTLKSCTVGWILSEIIRRLHSHFFEEPVYKNFTYKHIVGMQLRNRDNTPELLDYWLTQYERPMLPLKECNYDIELIYSDYVQQKRIPKLADFEILKVIGRGGFSKVLQVRKKDSGMLYAMKVISKAFVIEKGKADQIMAERRILSKLSHPFIVKLHYAFQSKHYLFLILDFCPGGELFYHLHNKVRFPEEAAKFYFAEILLAIEYLHSNHIVYRDLKPENVLFDMDGHVKLTDFGLSKENFTSRSRTYSFCGSPEYMSPEMLSRKGHSFSIDCYSLGAILYEMMTGLPPHYSKNRQQMYQRILNNPVTYPEYLSKCAVSLLDKLLRKNPKERLTASEIKRHKFLSNINWGDLLQRRIPPPYDLDYNVSHFDPEYTTQKVSWSEGDDTHEAAYRSQSLVDFVRDIDTDNEHKDNERSNDITVIVGNPDKLEKESEEKERQRKIKLKKTRKDLDQLNIYAKSLKANFELFLGYPYTRESKPIVQRKVGEKPSSRVSAPQVCTLLNKSPVKTPKKTFSIQATSLMGESNDQDILITESDENGEMSPKEYQKEMVVEEQMQKRCASTENLRKAVNKYTPQVRAKKKVGPAKPKYKPKVKSDPYETCKLLKAEQSKVTAGIIKLNDDMNGIISERKRKIAVEKPTRSPRHKAKISLVQGPKLATKPLPKPSIGTRNVQQTVEDPASWTVDSQAEKNDLPGLMDRRVSTNVSPSPKKFTHHKNTPRHQHIGTFKVSSIVPSSKKSDSFLRKQSSVKAMPVKVTSQRTTKVTAKKPSGRLNLGTKPKISTKTLSMPGSFWSESHHTPKNRPGLSGPRPVNININGDIKVTNHIIILQDKLASESHSSATNSPSEKKRVKAKGGDEKTDLDNNETEEHTHLFSPPHSPVVKLAYFSQHK